MSSTKNRQAGTFAAALATTALLGAGSALATPQTVQRALTTTGMNEQTTNYENAVWNAVSARFAPSSEAAGALQGGTARILSHNDARYLDFQNTSAHGVSGAVLFGFDILATQDLSLGVFGGYSELDTNTQLRGNVGNIEAQSFGIGALMGYRLGDGLALDGFVAYNYSDTDLEDAGVTANTESDRLTAGLGLSAVYDLAGFTFSPRASVSITQDWADSYAGGSSLDSTLFRGVLGAKAGTSYDMGGYQLNPYLLAAMEITVDDAGSASRVDDGASGRFGAGVSIPWGVALFTFEANTSGIGSNDYTDFGGQATISVVFN